MKLNTDDVIDALIAKYPDAEAIPLATALNDWLMLEIANFCRGTADKLTEKSEPA